MSGGEDALKREIEKAQEYNGRRNKRRAKGRTAYPEKPVDNED